MKMEMQRCVLGWLEGEQLLVSFDLFNEQQVLEARLDLSRIWLRWNEPDTGSGSGRRGGSNRWEMVQPRRECGCESSEAAVLPFWYVDGYRSRRRG